MKIEAEGYWRRRGISTLLESRVSELLLVGVPLYVQGSLYVDNGGISIFERMADDRALSKRSDYKLHVRLDRGDVARLFYQTFKRTSQREVLEILADAQSQPEL